MKSLFKIFAIVMALSFSHVIAQEKTTLYYDQNWQGLDAKKKATYYRIVNFDQDNNPVGLVETYYKSGKLRSKGEALFIDKLDDSKTLWKNNLLIYSEKGVKLYDQTYDDEGQPHGIWYEFNADGEKSIETEFTHGNPSKDHYLVYQKGLPVKYSYLTHSPVKLATAGKKLVPLTERKLVYQDGEAIQYYSIDGISLAVKFSREKAYGDYYAVFMTIENGTDKLFNLDPKDITAVFARKEKVDEAELLSYEYYIKKVNRKQNWSAAFNSFAQQQAANQAGYSASATAGVAINNYGDAAIGASSSQGYSGAEQYKANQNASNNIHQYNKQLYSIKQSITQGYLKINTVLPNSRIIGYVNIKYQKADGILVNIPLDGKIYQFAAKI